MKKTLIGPFFASNPYTGFLPVILFMALSPFYSIGQGLMISAALWLLILLATLLRRKSIRNHPALYTSAFTLIMMLPLEYPKALDLKGLTLSIALLSVLLMAAAISYWLFAKRHSPESYQGSSAQRLMMLEYAHSLKLLMRLGLFVLLFYLFVVKLWQPDLSANMTRVLMLLPAAMGTLLYVYELIRLLWVKHEFAKEEWISLADSQGSRVGRLARSMQGQFRDLDLKLPVVRIIAISQEMIYLSHNKCCDLCDSNCYDTPFFSFLDPSMEPDEQAQCLINERFCGAKQFRPQHLLSYAQTYEGQERLVYLYIAQLQSPELILCDKHPLTGKWWPIRQIEEQLDSNIFSPFLQRELPYLQQTVLLAEQIRQNMRQANKG